MKPSQKEAKSSALRNVMGSFNNKTSKSGGEMIMLFNHLFLYVIMNVERGEV